MKYNLTEPLLMNDRITALPGITVLSPSEHYEAVIDFLTVLRDNSESSDLLLKQLFTGKVGSITYLTDYLDVGAGFYSKELSELFTKLSIGESLRVIVGDQLLEGIRIKSPLCLEIIDEYLSPCLILPSSGAEWLIIDAGDPIVESRLVFRDVESLA